MKITSIRKTKYRYHVEVLNEETSEKGVFKLHEDFIVSANLSLKKGTNVDISILENLEVKTSAYGKAIWYMTLKSCTVFELKRYLRKKEFNNSVIDEIIEKLINLGLLNDAEYAKNYIESLIVNRCVGINYIKQKAFSKGLNSDLVAQQLSEYNEEDFLEAIKYWCEKERKKASGTSKTKMQKLLQNKGFSYDLINKGISNFEFDEGTTKEVNKDKMLRDLDKLFNRYSAKYSSYEVKGRLIKHLYSKGISYDEAKNLIDDFLIDKF